MKVAAIYIRVSSDEQVRHGYSLGEQQADLERFAKEKGYAIYDVYADEGISARKSYRRRKALQRLLADVKAGQINVIVMKCLDRWFRNVADFYKVQEILDKHNVVWECSQEDYNTTTTNGRLLLNLKLTIAQNESDQTSDRIKYIYQGKRRRHEEISNKATFGYEIKDKHLTIVEADRPVVEFIFQQIISGYSARSIPKAVYEKYGIVMDTIKVWRILRNKTYIGTRYGIDGYCPAIIPRGTFIRVQELLSRHKRPPAVGKVMLFSGKVFCPICGATLNQRWGNKNAAGEYANPVFVCRGHYSGLPTGSPRYCTFTGAVSENSIESYLLENIGPLLADYEASLKTTPTKQRKIQTHKKELEQKLVRLKDLYVDGLIDKETYRADYERLQGEIAVLLTKAARQRITPPAMSRLLSGTDFLTTYQALPKAKKRELWQTILQSVTPVPKTKPGRYRDFKVVFE